TPPSVAHYFPTRRSSDLMWSSTGGCVAIGAERTDAHPVAAWRAESTPGADGRTRCRVTARGVVRRCGSARARRVARRAGRRKDPPLVPLPLVRGRRAVPRRAVRVLRDQRPGDRTYAPRLLLVRAGGAVRLAR